MSTGAALGQRAPRVRGYTLANQLAASRSSPGSRGATRPRGAPGGKSAQRLRPASSAFQALVASGSMCRPEPLRAGPSTSHLARRKVYMSLGDWDSWLTAPKSCARPAARPKRWWRAGRCAGPGRCALGVAPTTWRARNVRALVT